MEIRLYRPSDKLQVIRLITRVLREFGLRYSSKLDRDLLDIRRYYFRRGGKFWILLEKGRVVGTAGVSHLNGRLCLRTARRHSSDGVCKFRRFYVSRRYRHKGWGLLLYAKSLAFAKRVGYNQIWTSTSLQFKDSAGFLERAGFRRTKRVLWPYQRAGIFYVLKLS